jgi:hypothetical protein
MMQMCFRSTVKIWLLCILSFNSLEGQEDSSIHGYAFIEQHDTSSILEKSVEKLDFFLKNKLSQTATEGNESIKTINKMAFEHADDPSETPHPPRYVDKSQNLPTRWVTDPIPIIEKPARYEQYDGSSPESLFYYEYFDFSYALGLEPIAAEILMNHFLELSWCAVPFERQGFSLGFGWSISAGQDNLFYSGWVMAAKAFWLSNAEKLNTPPEETTEEYQERISSYWGGLFGGLFILALPNQLELGYWFDPGFRINLRINPCDFAYDFQSGKDQCFTGLNLSANLLQKDWFYSPYTELKYMYESGSLRFTSGMKIGLHLGEFQKKDKF